MPDATEFDQLSKEIDASLLEWQRIREHEDATVPDDWSDWAAALSIERSNYAMHQEWASRAEQLLRRVQPQIADNSQGLLIADRLSDALGLTLARLKMTPEMAGLAVMRANNAPSKSVKELRDELHTQIRA